MTHERRGDRLPDEGLTLESYSRHYGSIRVNYPQDFEPDAMDDKKGNGDQRYGRSPPWCRHDGKEGPFGIKVANRIVFRKGGTVKAPWYERRGERK